MTFRKKALYQCSQWFRQGDHPRVTAIPLSLEVKSSRREKLGWLPTTEGGHVVYPGDWIVVDSYNRAQTINANTFARLYEPATQMILPRAARDL